MYARSRMSALSQLFVANDSTFCTSACEPSGFLRKSLTMAVRVCSWTCCGRQAHQTRTQARASPAHGKWILCERLQKGGKDLVRIDYLLGILAQYPYKRSFGFRLVKVVQICAKSWYDAFVI